MYTAWGILCTLQIVSSRYLKILWNKNLLIHAISGFVTLIIFIAGFAVALNNFSGKFVFVGHSQYSWVFVPFGFMIILGGIVANVLRLKSRWLTQMATMVRRIHKFFAVFILLFSLLVIYKGMAQYELMSGTKGVTYIFWAHLAIVILLILICEALLFSFYNKKLTLFVDKEEWKDFTAQEFHNEVHNKCKKWAILDDMIVDLQPLLMHHPGGTFLLNIHVGRDISKFFYGGYQLETKNLFGPHKHSNMAYKIVQDITVGRLIQEAPLVESEIKNSYQVNRHTKTFQFQTNQNVYKNYFSDINDIGKHFLINVKGDTAVYRHYTICSTMRPELYKALLKSVQTYQPPHNSTIEKEGHTRLNRTNSEVFAPIP